MDLATHAMLGASAAYATADKRIGRGAAVLGTAGALMPDVDVLLQKSDDPLFAIELHRHFTHSLVVAVVASTVLGFLLFKLLGTNSTRHTIVALFSGYLSAILLDTCTSYGTQLFWPFSSQRVTLSVVSIIDPILFFSLLACLWLMLHRRSRTVARISVALCIAYLCLGAIQKQRAESLLRDSLANQPVSHNHVLVKPSFANIIVWRAMAWNESEISVKAIRPGLLSNHRVYPGDHAPRPNAERLKQWAGASTTHQSDLLRFSSLSAGLLVFNPHNPIMLGDARFSMLPNSLTPLWGVTVQAAKTHLDYVTHRQISDEQKSCFIKMLRGKPAICAHEPRSN